MAELRFGDEARRKLADDVVNWPEGLTQEGAREVTTASSNPRRKNYGAELDRTLAERFREGAYTAAPFRVLDDAKHEGDLAVLAYLDEVTS